MRFVAGRGAVEELLTEGAAAKSHREDVAGRALRLSGWLAGAPWRKQLVGAPWRRNWRRHGEEPSGRSCQLRCAEVAKKLLAGAPGARYIIQQRRHVQKAFLQRSNC